MTDPSQIPFPKRAFQPASWRLYWIPLIATAGSLLVSVMPGLPGWLGNGFFALFLAGLAWFLASAIVWFAKRRPSAGLASLACLAVSVAAVVPALMAFIVLRIGAEDAFAKDLSLPEGIELAEPAERHSIDDADAEDRIDSFQAALRAAIDGPGGGDATITTSVPSLGALHRDHPDLLQRYLAAHPGWRVHLDKGGRHATRRWMVEGAWHTRLHGYYSDFGPHTGNQRFQVRVNLGLSGRPWSHGAEELPSGTRVAPSLSKGNALEESYCSFREHGVVVELFEQAETAERRMTKAALAELEREFAPLAASPSWETARSLLPEGAVVVGEPSFRLFNDVQPGIYNAEIRCNPGEPGRLFLKAFEITRGTRLSEGRLDKRGSEFPGWSDDPGEQFLAEVHFTIYEGDWGEFYGARFEVWFQPESGAPERRLMQSNWKIEGWMH